MKSKLVTIIVGFCFILTSLPLTGDEVAKGQSEIKEGNVWTTSDGTKYFTCPVMKGEMLVADATSMSVVNGVRYYHCCPPCQGPFRAEPEKFIAGNPLPSNITEVDDKGFKHYLDPVNGRTGVVDESTVYVDHEGHRYFFSDKKSLTKFQESPKKFIEQPDS